MTGCLRANSQNARKPGCGEAAVSANAPTAICWSPPTDREAAATLPKAKDRSHSEWPPCFCAISQRHIFRAAAHRFLGRAGARLTDCSTSQALGSIQVLSRVDETSNIQILIDAKYVTKGVTHRWAGIRDLFPADRRAHWPHRCHQGQVTLGGRWPPAIKQNTIAFHHMLANSLADVLPYMNLEQKAKKERTGVSVAKMLALVQADVRAKNAESWLESSAMQCTSM